jgi:hypothetical protein
MSEKVFGTTETPSTTTGRIKLYGAELKTVQGGSAVPWFIPEGETFTVSEFNQALYNIPIDCEGTIDVEGYLIQIKDADGLEYTNVYTKNQSVTPIILNTNP